MTLQICPIFKITDHSGFKRSVYPHNRDISKKVFFDRVAHALDALVIVKLTVIIGMLN